MKLKTVNEMFDYARNNNLKLLSDFEANFWQEYVSNHSQYDALFRRMYFSFKYFYSVEKNPSKLLLMIL